MKNTKENIIEKCQKMQEHITELGAIIEEYEKTCNVLIQEVTTLRSENAELRNKACKCVPTGV